MKRLLVLVLAISLSAGLCACKARDSASSAPEKQKGARENVVVSEEPGARDSDSSESEPEPESEPEEDPGKAKAAAEEFLEAVKTGSKSKIGQYIDYDALFRITPEQNPEWQFEQILPLMTCEIFSAGADGDEASVSVKITNVDMGVILPLWFEKVMTLEYDNALSDDPLDREELDAKGRTIFVSLLKERGEGRVEKLADIRFRKDGGAWKPQPSDELGDALLGRYFSAYADVAGGMQAGN